MITTSVTKLDAWRRRSTTFPEFESLDKYSHNASSAITLIVLCLSLDTLSRPKYNCAVILMFRENFAGVQEHACVAEGPLCSMTV